MPVHSTDPGEWVTPKDYPTMSLLNGSVGVTTFRLQVNELGEPEGCTIVETSGFEELDARTCEVVTDRARFRPPLNDKGEQVESTYTNRVRWVLPNGDQFRPGQLPKFIVESIIETTGVISSCVVTQRSDVFATMPSPCRQILGRQAYDPAEHPESARLKMRIVTTMEFESLD